VKSTDPRRLAAGATGWPDRFAHLEQPPPWIWLWGTEAPMHPAVAVVGSRRATAIGLEIARTLGRDLGEAGIQVISGMARGIDAAAQRGALEDGGTTVAVLGCGVDVCYPPEEATLRDGIVANGCLISEEERGALPLPHQFPKRNRLIAALAVAVVVVEATLRSGALSTARWAADLGREVLAVPGSIRSSRSDGTNRLIRDGARPFLGLDDLFDAVPELVGPAAGGTGARRRRRTVPRLSAELEDLLGHLGPDPVHPDAVGAACGLSAAAVASSLGALELAGAVMSLPGGLVARTF